MKAYLDCNILLDWALEREPFVDSATILINLIAEKKVTGVVSPLVMANVHYTMRKMHGKSYAHEFLQECHQHFEFCDNSSNALERAIIHPYKDFEDDIHYFSAIGNSLDCIVTRNAKYFPKNGDIAIVSPDDILIQFGY